MAKRLKSNTRETDLVSRFGGDEFVVCLDLLNDIESTIAKTEQLIQELSRPIYIDDASHSVGVSIGVSIYPDFAQDHLELLTHADQAMYVAKARDGSNYVVATQKSAPQAGFTDLSNEGVPIQ